MKLICASFIYLLLKPAMISYDFYSAQKTQENLCDAVIIILELESCKRYIKLKINKEYRVAAYKMSNETILYINKDYKYICNSN